LIPRSLTLQRLKGNTLTTPIKLVNRWI